MGGVSPHHPTRSMGSVVSSPSPGRKWILCIYKVRKKPSGIPFSVFLSDGGAPKRREARENFAPSPPPFDGLYAGLIDYGVTLGVEESGKPKTFRSIFEDPLGELFVTLEQLREPETNRRRRPRHFAPQVGHLGVEHAVQRITQVLNTT